MNYARLLHQTHKWISLLIGIQILLWVSGGVVMSYFSISEVRGEHNKRDVPQPPLKSTDVRVSIASLLSNADSIQTVTLRSLLGRSVYELGSDTGVELVDATTGEKLTPLSEDYARRLAQSDYSGPGKLVRANLLEELLGEIRGRTVPVWQVEFDDAISTKVYISPETGKVVARRNTIWRIFDFFWMLHIMDYDERSDFNNPLLLAASITALFFSITGLLLLIESFRRR